MMQPARNSSGDFRYVRTCETSFFVALLAGRGILMTQNRDIQRQLRVLSHAEKLGMIGWARLCHYQESSARTRMPKNREPVFRQRVVPQRRRYGQAWFWAGGIFFLSATFLNHRLPERARTRAPTF